MYSYAYAGIIINSDAEQLDRVFTYKIPLDLMSSIDIGYRVKVPFGKGNKTIDGFIVELYEECHETYKIKDIVCICDEFLLLECKIYY